MIVVNMISNKQNFLLISNEVVEYEIFDTAYIIGGPLVTYQIEYLPDTCPHRQFQTLISQ